MSSTTHSVANTKAMLWAGWIIGVLPALMLLFSSGTKFAMPDFMRKGFDHLGWNEDLALTLGIIELVCTVLYLIPRTAVLGAILLTGYLGGAIATHVRIGEDYKMQLALGVLVWGGLYLRDPRLRASAIAKLILAIKSSRFP